MNQKLKEKNLAPTPSVPYLPADLPFDHNQRQWLGGFLAGLHSRFLVTQSATGAPTSAAVTLKPITIIYGSQTGNSENVAEQAAEQAKALGMAPTVLDMDDADIHQLASVERLLVITSTYGEGEMPDNAQALWEAAEADDAPSFANTFYSVLALGDTNYDGFCVAGKMWDERLQALGGQRIAERVDCDIDFEEPAQEWLEKALPEIFSRGSDEGSAVAAEASAPAKKKAKSKYNRQNPLVAELTTKKVLTGDESSKEICHFEFSLGDSGESYNAGDALNIMPLNRPDLIEEVLTLFSASADTVVNDKPLASLLEQELEIRTPSKELIQTLAQRTGDDELNRLLVNDDPEALADFLWGKDIVGLLKAYPEANLSLEEFINLCKPLAARAYSISSSIKKHENEVHLTIGSVRYKTEGRELNGVCSTYLADIADVGEQVRCYFSPNKHFAVPEDQSLPMIMVGPGTGLAPFRAFLEEREITGANGDNWLFFGDRNASSDFIYEEEIKNWQESGLLTRLDLAFSRDQKEKIYVQDRMLEQGADFFAWLERGAYFYICGDAYRMAKDVDAALHQLIAEHGKLSEEQAVEYVNTLKKQKRYVRDVY